MGWDVPRPQALELQPGEAVLASRPIMESQQCLRRLGMPSSLLGKAESLMFLSSWHYCTTLWGTLSTFFLTCGHKWGTMYVEERSTNRRETMNKLKVEKKIQVISALVEGNSIRSTERMIGVHRDTIMRLMVRVGTACKGLMDVSMRELPCKRIQVDEIWAFVGKKQRHLKPEDDRTRLGDVWTFVALDADSKLVPCYRVGQRNAIEARLFMSDLSSRLTNHVQISSDLLSQ